MTARLVAIEGVDGAGKGTQARRLHELLLAEGYRSRLVGFPRYDKTLFGQIAGEFLNGRFGQLDDVHPLLVAVVFAGDRHESRQWLLEALSESDVVVCDRYVASNLAHQGAKLDDRAERDELCERVERIEFEIHALPRPNWTVLLDIPVSVAQELVGRKDPRNYTDKAADLQESNVPYLDRVRQVYRELATGRADWTMISCCAAGELRTLESIGDDIRAALKELLPVRTG